MFYECQFCNKLFKREAAFIKHYCNERRKHDELTNINGQIGFFLYERWVLIRHSRKVDIEDFKASRFFNAFVKFAKYYKSIKGLADIDQFLRLMISKNIQPSNWVTDRVISYYLDVVDTAPPIHKINETCKYIIKLSEAYDCSTSEIYKHIDFYVMIDFIKMHKLSPWILLHSRKFIVWVRHLDDEQQLIIDAVVDSSKWKHTFSADRQHTILAKRCCEELDI
jgi:hypothetical protein